jgi:transcription antitermination factor NusG
MQVEVWKSMRATRIEPSEQLSNELSTREAPSDPWYVTYTSPRHEKHVARQLEERGISSFLPLYKSTRRWKDRKKELELPLFPSYVFAQIQLERRVDLLRIPGVVSLVSFQGRPVPASLAEIETLQRGMGGSSVLRPHPYLKVGRKVRVQHGPMTGLEGIFVRWKDRVRIVVSITLIQRSVAVEVDEADVETIS